MICSVVQTSLEQQVGLEEGRLAAVALRSKCRKLESESLFADVFEKYEEEIRQLQVLCLIKLVVAVCSYRASQICCIFPVRLRL